MKTPLVLLSFAMGRSVAAVIRKKDVRYFLFLKMVSRQLTSSTNRLALFLRKKGGSFSLIGA